MNQLLMIKSNLTQKMNRLDSFSNELPNKISCIPEFFIDESDLFVNQLSKNYLQRINFKATFDGSKTLQPKCNEFLALDYSMSLFEHLEAMKKRNKLKMEPEDSFGSKELGEFLVKPKSFLTTICFFSKAYQPQTSPISCTHRWKVIRIHGRITCWVHITGDSREMQRKQ